MAAPASRHRLGLPNDDEHFSIGDGDGDEEGGQNRQEVVPPRRRDDEQEGRGDGLSNVSLASASSSAILPVSESHHRAPRPPLTAAEIQQMRISSSLS